MDFSTELEGQGYAFVKGDDVLSALGADRDEWRTFLTHWDDLGEDNYLGTDYIFRLRRFGRIAFVPSTGELALQTGSEFFQSAELNKHAGGTVRSFEPLPDSAFKTDAFQDLLRWSFDRFSVEDEYRDRTWTIDVNFFRVRTDGAQSYSPTPEGIHRDGYPFGVISVVGRHNIEGGVSHVYSLDEEFLDSRLMSDSLDSLYAYDPRVKHYTTPLFSRDGNEGHRDLLGYVYYLPGTKYDKEG